MIYGLLTGLGFIVGQTTKIVVDTTEELVKGALDLPQAMYDGYTKETKEENGVEVMKTEEEVVKPTPSNFNTFPTK